MANHVSTHVEFSKISDKALEYLRDLYETRVRKEHNWFPDLFVDGETLTYEESEQYAWTVDNIGPKWSYFEDFDSDNRGAFNVISAWSTPEAGLNRLFEALGEIDPDLVVSVRYEDEMPNFIGAAVYTADGLEEYHEWEYKEIMERAFAEVEGLRESWDEDEKDFTTDEARDMMWESQWEIINDMQREFFDEVLDYYLEKENDDVE